jgi:hypothetical protein
MQELKHPHTRTRSHRLPLDLSVVLPWQAYPPDLACGRQAVPAQDRRSHRACERRRLTTLT